MLDFQGLKIGNILVGYGTPYLAEKKVFWEIIEAIVDGLIGPWLMVGDLSEIVSKNEKFGTHCIWMNKLFLKEFMQNTGSIDLEFMQNLEASVLHLRKEKSNHCPIIIRTERRMVKKAHPFRFFEACTSQSSSIKLVKDAWNVDSKRGMHSHKLNRSLKDTSKAL